MGLESKVGAEPGPQPGQGAALLRRAGRAPRKFMNKCWFIGDDRRCWMVFLMVECFIFYRRSIIIIVMLDVSKMSDVGFNSSIRSSSFPRDGAELGFSASTFFSMFGPEQPVPLQKNSSKYHQLVGGLEHLSFSIDWE